MSETSTQAGDSSPEFDELPPYLVPQANRPPGLSTRTDLLIVDKPHHLLSVPGRHPLNHDSLIRRLQPRYPEVNAVHRLDLDTSGIMVVPKHKASLSELARQFQRRQIEKGTQLFCGENCLKRLARSNSPSPQTGQTDRSRSFAMNAVNMRSPTLRSLSAETTEH